MADSLSQSMLQQWQNEKQNWLRHHPQPWDERTEDEYHEHFSTRIDDWLDTGSGSCLLRRAKFSHIVSGALLHFDGSRYEMWSFVVMPNHVHALFSLGDKYSLESVLKSWKGFTGREINRQRNQPGQFWQEGYWDRMVRNERHFAACLEYIRMNPIRAGLKDGEYVYYKKKGI